MAKYNQIVGTLNGSHATSTGSVIKGVFIQISWQLFWMIETLRILVSIGKNVYSKTGKHHAGLNLE